MITKKKNDVKDYSATTTSTQKVSEGFAETIYPTSVQGSQLWGRSSTTSTSATWGGHFSLHSEELHWWGCWSWRMQLWAVLRAHWQAPAAHHPSLPSATLIPITCPSTYVRWWYCWDGCLSVPPLHDLNQSCLPDFQALGLRNVCKAV